MPGFLVYALVGFCAQLVDGTAGMAYGLSCRTFLRAVTGLPAGLVSAIVHWAEAPVTLASGISHLSLGNVDRRLLVYLLLPGVVGGLCGTYWVVQIVSGMERLICWYLVLMGLVILWRALFPRHQGRRFPMAGVGPLALAGGFLDAAGGGGWGQVVATTLIAGGGDAKKIIGSVNAAEAGVTLVQAIAFFAIVGEIRAYLPVIAGLVTGGLLAAPFAAWCCTRVPTKPLLVGVGLLITGYNVYELLIV